MVKKTIIVFIITPFVLFFGLLHHRQIQTINNGMVNLEGEISSLESEKNDLESSIDGLESQKNDLEDRVDELESR